MCSVEGDRLYPFAHQAVHRLGKKQIADEGKRETGLHSASKERGHGITRTETGAGVHPIRYMMLLLPCNVARRHRDGGTHPVRLCVFSRLV